MRSPADVALGSRVRGMRIRCGVSQAGLAEALGVTQAGISHWENGHRAMGPDVVEKIAAALQIHTDELYSAAAASAYDRGYAAAIRDTRALLSQMAATVPGREPVMEPMAGTKAGPMQAEDVLVAVLSGVPVSDLRPTCECDPLGEGLDHHEWCSRYVDDVRGRDCGVCMGVYTLTEDRTRCTRCGAPGPGDPSPRCPSCHGTGAEPTSDGGDRCLACRGTGLDPTSRAECPKAAVERERNREMREVYPDAPSPPCPLCEETHDYPAERQDGGPDA